MIKIVDVGGNFCPRLFCDSCGKEMTDHTEGICQIEAGNPIHFVHKTHIDPNCDKHSPDGRKVPWMPIDAFLYHLHINLNIDWESAKRQTEKFI